MNLIILIIVLRSLANKPHVNTSKEEKSELKEKARCVFFLEKWVGGHYWLNDLHSGTEENCVLPVRGKQLVILHREGLRF